MKDRVWVRVIPLVPVSKQRGLTCARNITQLARSANECMWKCPYRHLVLFCSAESPVDLRMLLPNDDVRWQAHAVATFQRVLAGWRPRLVVDGHELQAQGETACMVLLAWERTLFRHLSGLASDVLSRCGVLHEDLEWEHFFISPLDHEVLRPPSGLPVPHRCSEEAAHTDEHDE